RTGIDPDVAVLEPAPSDFDDLTSLRLWEPGRVPPRLAIEVVSASHPYKDYGSIQERYAAMGAEELLVFDPLLSGPRSLGGPVPLQLWRRDVTLSFERVCFGGEPVHSLVLDAWFLAEGRTLHISDDRKGMRCWLTDSERLRSATDEAARATAEAGRANAEAERANAEAERAKTEAERANAEAERANAEAERAKTEAEQERRARQELERRLQDLATRPPR
ncbi:MAG TPA: Uma2 family endonuclease, partial [Polyangiaceae bacterium]|nr:Uma2 family endonuclease [Polyangiaceae bacterium]